jgi:hypothetical protein
MTRFLGLMLSATAAALLAAAPAGAQEVCPEGRTFGGDCVNPGLAEAQRQTAIIYSHPKISQTAFPVLPVDDREFRYPNALIPDPLTPSGIGEVPSP